MTKTPDRIAFVVDTEDYSGNFERGMCAFLTGKVEDHFHDCDTKMGEKVRASFPQEVRDYFADHVLEVLNTEKSYPFHTAVAIWPTPGWFNHGAGGHFRDGQEEEAFEDYKKVRKEYDEKHPDSHVVTNKTLNKCPAYQSVAIFFDEVPPDHILKLMKERAQEYCKTRIDIMGGHSPLTFVGCRLMKEFVETKHEYVGV